MLQLDVAYADAIDRQWDHLARATTSPAITPRATT
jgi:hypothetical protein